MKKNFVLTGVVMLLTVTVVTAFSASSRTGTSDLLNANVEALAAGESGNCTYNEVHINQDKHSLKCKGQGSQCCEMN